MNRSIRSIRYYGWTPDLPDHRDSLYLAPHKMLAKLPAKVDLRTQCPEVWDQGDLGSCTANAIGAAFQFELMKQKAHVFTPSRLFIYYNERVIEHSVMQDSGAQIRDGFKTINQQGVCPETMWPYNISEFAQKPYAKCYDDAVKHKSVSYHSVTQDLSQMKSCLAEGYPIVIGFTVYSAFEGTQVAKTGVLNMPQKGETVVGGHAVMVVGYDDKTNRFIVRNSWGADWGMAGYFTMPYDYLVNSRLARDFWTLRMVTDAPAAKKAAAKKTV